MKLSATILTIAFTGLGSGLGSLAVERWERLESQYGAYAIVEELMERGAVEAHAGPVDRDRLRKACGGRNIGVFFSFRSNDSGQLKLGLACRNLWETWDVTRIETPQAES